MSDLDLTELRRLASEVTAGPWRVAHEGHRLVVVDEENSVVARVAPDMIGPTDAAYVAAVSPDVVLALLERLRVSEEAVARVEALVHKWAQQGSGLSGEFQPAMSLAGASWAARRALAGDGSIEVAPESTDDANGSQIGGNG